MSRLEDLIQTLCPDGVEYKTVGELCVVYTGGEAPEDFLRVKVPVGDYVYPIFSNGINENSIYGYSKEFRIGEDAVTFSSIGTIGFPTIRKGKFTPIIRLKVIVPKKDSSLTLSYLKYALETASFAKNKSSVPNINANMIKNIVLPLPPLPVQEEIVLILDTFSGVVAELEQKLEAEQAARVRQYEHYRESLLSHKAHSSITWKTLGDVSLLITKGTTPSSFETSGVSFVKTESFEGSTINNKKLSYVSEGVHKTDLKRSILQENDILFSIAGSIGKCVFVPKEILPANTNQALAIIRLKKDVNRKYIFHLLQSKRMMEYIYQNVKGSAQPNLNLQQMGNYPVPLPPNEVQEEIVSILDRFDALVNDLKNGLPAEIALRRKQYEYYRDKLLTFQPLHPPISSSPSTEGV